MSKGLDLWLKNNGLNREKTTPFSYEVLVMLFKDFQETCDSYETAEKQLTEALENAHVLIDQQQVKIDSGGRDYEKELYIEAWAGNPQVVVKQFRAFFGKEPDAE